MQTFLILVVLAAVAFRSSTIVVVGARLSRSDAFYHHQSGRQQQLQDLRSKQLLAIINSMAAADADYSSSLASSSSRTLPLQQDSYPSPSKRTLSLYNRWKTLEQLKKNMQNPAEPVGSSSFIQPEDHQHVPGEPVASARQQKKIMSSSSRNVEMILPAPLNSGLSDQDLVSSRISSRASQRSLRPPGQPLRWG